MNDAERRQKLALARKKLRQYRDQSQQGRSQSRASLPAHENALGVHVPGADTPASAVTDIPRSSVTIYGTGVPDAQQRQPLCKTRTNPADDHSPNANSEVEGSLNGDLSRGRRRKVSVGARSAASLPPYRMAGSAARFHHDDAASPFVRVSSKPSAIDQCDETSAVAGDVSIFSASAPDRAQPTFGLHDVSTPPAPEPVSIVTQIDATQTNGAHAHQAAQQHNELSFYKQQNEALSAQLNQLYSHYATLHAAYTEYQQQQPQLVQQTEKAPVLQNGRHEGSVVDSENNSDTGSNSTIKQQQQTIAVLVEEKTSLQSQLRSAMTMANEQHQLAEHTAGRVEALRAQLSAAETAAASADAMRATLAAQKNELERLRTDAARWEARANEWRQDKCELAARLKVKARETDQLRAEAGDARKELQMKQIYIRQLCAETAGARSTDSPQLQQQHDELAAMLDQATKTIAKLNADLVDQRTSHERAAQEAEAARGRYEQHGRALNAQVAELSSRLQQATEENHVLRAKLTFNSEQMQAHTTNQMTTGEPAEHIGHDERQQASQEKITDGMEAVEECQQCIQKTSELEMLQQRLQQQTQALHEMECQVLSLQNKLLSQTNEVEQLKGDLVTATQSSGSMQTLIEQLQSERGTVSRAVAQNRELKDQLEELQQRFVSMSERSMATETALQAAQHSLRTQQEVEQHQQGTEGAQSPVDSGTERSAPSSPATPRVDTRDAQVTASMDPFSPDSVTSDYEGMQLRAELAETRTESARIAAENAELHRILEQNSEDENRNNIRVELMRALDRINVLSHENTELRAAAEAYHASAVPPVSSADATSQCDSLPTAANAIETKPSSDAATATPAVVAHDVSTQMHEKQQNEPAPASACHEQEGMPSPPTPATNHHTATARHSTPPTPSEGDSSDRDDDMRALAGRFTAAMSRCAELAERNEQLEHVLEQLQAETETIGEYITIYQHQRKLMRQRLQEKEQSVARLSDEKHALQQKFADLQSLVMRWLREQNVLHTYNEPTAALTTLSGDATALPEQTQLCVEVREQAADDAASISSGRSSSTAARRSKHRAQRSPNTDDLLHLLADMKRLVDTEYSSSSRPTSTACVCSPDPSQPPDGFRPIGEMVHCKECRGKLIVL